MALFQKIPRCQLPVYIRGEFKRRGANSNKTERVRKGRTNSKEAERIEKKTLVGLAAFGRTAIIQYFIGINGIP